MELARIHCPDESVRGSSLERWGAVFCGAHLQLRDQLDTPAENVCGIAARSTDARSAKSIARRH
eukprot:745871-Pleurochrysis_carterae.AAC.2